MPTSRGWVGQHVEKLDLWRTQVTDEGLKFVAHIQQLQTLELGATQVTPADAPVTTSHEELGFRHVRFHGLLSDDVGTRVDEQDALLHCFLNGDRIWDFLLSIGMKPFLELSFMPTALASEHRTVFH